MGLASGLSAVICVKNEEEAIGRCLSSVVPWVDEIILLDTGCNDRTVEIAKDAGKDKLKVFCYDVGNPIRSFSEMRQKAASFSTRQFQLWLDAGDAIEGDFQKVLDALYGDEMPDGIYLQTHFGGTKYWRERIVATPFVLWVGRVHEFLDVSGLHLIHVKDAWINHKWYKKTGREDSLERNIRLLLEGIEEVKIEETFLYSRYIFYLGQDLMAYGEKQEAVKYYKKRITLPGFFEERAWSLYMLSTYYMDSGDFDSALAYAFDGLKTAGTWKEFYYVIGDIYYRMGRFEEALGWYLHCLSLPKAQRILWYDENIYSWLPYCQLSYTYEKLGDIERAVYWAEKDVMFAPPSQKKRAEDHLLSLLGSRCRIFDSGREAYMALKE